MQLHHGLKGSADNNLIYSSAMGTDLIPATLSRDFGSMVGDPQYADIRFIAEGRALFAHRFILEARSPYFRAMFRSGMIESFVVNGKPTDIVVPDSFVCLLRMLIFLYTDLLPEGSDTALLEDLLTADRYHIMDMRCLCENMLAPNKYNWIELLRVSNMVNSTRLKLETMCFVRDNLGDSYTKDATLKTSLIEFRDIFESIIEMRQVSYPTPPSKILIDQVTENAKLEKEKKHVYSPWNSILFLGLFCVLYVIAIEKIKFGAMLPFVNAALMGVVFYFLYKKMVSE